MWQLITLPIIMLCSFLFQIWKLYTIKTIIPWSRCLGKERKNTLRHYLFSDKIIQNCLKIDTTHRYAHYLCNIIAERFLFMPLSLVRLRAFRLSAIKVIKSSVPELRSRKCFSCFGIPMVYVYMFWTFYVRFT